jgi:protease II
MAEFTAGGREFGPDWHQAALKTKRQVAYDDFIAVSEDEKLDEVRKEELMKKQKEKHEFLEGISKNHQP